MEKLKASHRIVSWVLGFTLLFVSVGLVEAQKDPSLKFKEIKWDFGNIKQGKILTHVFKFKNEGESPLLIHNVRTSCGCAAALVSSREISPGKSGELKVTFNTKGYEGQQTKFVYVDSNDPQEPKKQLFVSASIDVPPRPRIDVDRYSIELGLLLETEEIQTLSRISNAGERELTVEMSNRNAMFFKGKKEITAPLKIAAGKSVEVNMKIKPRKTQGLIREYVLLKTNDPQRPNLSIYVSGYIVTEQQLKDLFARYKDKLK
jgi:hypothetical protein